MASLEVSAADIYSAIVGDSAFTFGSFQISQDSFDCLPMRSTRISHIYWWCGENHGSDKWTNREHEANSGSFVSTYRCSGRLWWGTSMSQTSSCMSTSSFSQFVTSMVVYLNPNVLLLLVKFRFRTIQIYVDGGTVSELWIWQVNCN